MKVLVVIAIFTIMIWMGSWAIGSLQDWWRGGEIKVIDTLEAAYDCQKNDSRQNFSYVRADPGLFYTVNNIRQVLFKSDDGTEEIIKQAYRMQVLEDDYDMGNFNWNEKPYVSYNNPDYYSQIDQNEYKGVTCEFSLFGPLDEINIDERECRVKIYKGDLKENFLSSINSGPYTCKKVDNPEYQLESFARRRERERDYEKQRTAKRVFGDAYESDYQSIEHEYEVNRDYEEWKDNK